MVKIQDILDVAKLTKHIEDGYISSRPHPIVDGLVILNYTHKCQYDWLWDNVTIQTRGLIVDKHGDVVARPFPKFFTVDQITQLRNSVHNLYGVKFKDIFKQSFKAYDKLDGSLGILYVENNGHAWSYAVATRGSFESDQAKKATEIFHNQYHGVTDFQCDKFTYLFEIIYPENRIVVDYGDKEELRLLAVIDIETGKDDWEEFERVSKDVRTIPTKFIGEFFSVDELPDEANAEGYVLVFENDFRLKYKHEEYKRLHRLICGLSEKRIWESLKNGDDILSVMENVPDEFYNWVKNQVAHYKNGFIAIKHEAYKVFKEKFDEFSDGYGKLNRKAFAQSVQDYDNKNIVFMMLDEKDYEEAIWRKLEPKTNTQFVENEDG